MRLVPLVVLCLVANLPAGIPAEAAAAAQETLGGALAVAAELPAQLGAELVRVADGAFISGLHAVSLIGAVGFVLAACVAGFLLRDIQIHPGGHHDYEAPHEAAPEIEAERELEPVT